MGVDRYSMMDDEARELAEQIRPLIARLLDNQVPLEEGATTRIMTDVVIVAARNEYMEDGQTFGLVTILALDEDFPDYKGIGLLRKAEQMYHADTEDED